MSEANKLPQLIFLFGLAGSGKSFAAKTIAKHFSYHWHDFDADLPPDMLLAVKNREAFNPEMRAAFAQIMSDRISALKAKHSRLIVSQGIYKQAMRDIIRKSHPEVQFICVSSAPEMIEVRLKQRGDFVTPEFARSIEKYFEADAEAKLLRNNSGTEELLEEFAQLF